MNIAIIGYGNMGKEVEQAAAEKKIKVVKIITEDENYQALAINKNNLKNVDVCIEFTTPTAVWDNIEAVATSGKDIVVGTTGWYNKLADVQKLVKSKNIGLLYCPNFSLGVNLLYQIVNNASHIFNKFDAYDVMVSEIHHKNKADSPSGTALSLGNIILQNIKRKNEVLHETSHTKIKPEQLHITSTRVGSVIGKHSVMFDSDADTIEITHTAKNRRGFALGALLAAEWLVGKKGVFTMKDVMNSI
ncbi:MAG: 4-hydroxy-tetrahydrodipicolinate reductase [Bacteroidota bacterium]|nr:4-hydroxy-tetrahydrodipicolinate reductase [Bacteroidota bacterium]